MHAYILYLFQKQIIYTYKYPLICYGFGKKVAFFSKRISHWFSSGVGALWEHWIMANVGLFNDKNVMKYV